MEHALHGNKSDISPVNVKVLLGLVLGSLLLKLELKMCVLY